MVKKTSPEQSSWVPVDEPAAPETTGEALAVRPPSEIAKRDWADPSDPTQPHERRMPFATLMQHSSQAVKDGEAEIGDMVTSTGINLGKRVTFIPLFSKRGATKFFDKESGESGLECKSQDGVWGSRYGKCSDCQFNYREWKKNPRTGKDMPPQCTEVRIFPSLIVACDNFADGSEIGVTTFQFARTSFPCAKKILSQHDATNSPFYRFRWELTSKERKFPMGAANVYQISFRGKNPEDLMEMCETTVGEWSGATIDMPDKIEFNDSEVSSKGDESPF